MFKLSDKLAADPGNFNTSVVATKEYNRPIIRCRCVYTAGARKCPDIVTNVLHQVCRPPAQEPIKGIVQNPLLTNVVKREIDIGAVVFPGNERSSSPDWRRTTRSASSRRFSARRWMSSVSSSTAGVIARDSLRLGTMSLTTSCFLHIAHDNFSLTSLSDVDD